MIQKVQQSRWLRLAVSVFGAIMLAVAVNLFIVPQGLYSGGLYGLCQVARTLLVTGAGLSMPFDIAGILYLVVNLPLIWMAWRTMGREFVVSMTVTTVVNSLALAAVPVPATPFIADKLTSCMVGGILGGFSCGLILTCGGSTGGLDVLGLYFSKKGKGFTVGRFSITFNAALYALCAVLFNLTTAIYSAIYMVFSALFLDRIHQQNITAQMLIFTKEDPTKLGQVITERLERSYTFWEGQGGYSGEEIHVLCVCLSKYEVASLQIALHQLDPHVFFVVQEGVRVGGNFPRHLAS